MLVVWSWLMELLEFERPVSAEEGAEALTRAGLEVEEFRRVGNDLPGVVVVEVVGKEKHPKADKLTVVQVIDAPNAQPTTVVCGAPNVPKAGGRVLWAKPGAVLPGGMEIGERKLKGILSSGMLCAEDELGLGEDHEGIMVLGDEHKDVPLGALAQDGLGLGDVVFDLCIPANRADALGHIGVARELAALLNGRVKMPSIEGPTSPAPSERTISIQVADQNACPRYVARIVQGLTVGPSPLWMRQRLRHVGVRPINNLVDVTNYAMFEFAQPLHAFDYDRLQGKTICVRTATAGEQITTLDGVERTLDTTDLVIADGDGAVALAGVMGGSRSEVSAETNCVLLESATFDPLCVRRTARKLGLHSASSHRFERKVDPSGCDFVSKRAANLLAELGNGVVTDTVVDCYPVVEKPKKVSLRLSRCEALIGIAIEPAVIRATLERQGLCVEDETDGVLLVTVPTFRGDITREVDLIEEVVRIYGFDRVPATLPRTTVSPKARDDGRSKLACRAMVQAGFCEAITYGFTSPERIAHLKFPADDPRSLPIPIDNPLSQEQSVMRTSLWPNLLTAVSHNHKRDVYTVRLFELGHIFLGAGENIREPRVLCAVLTGRREEWLSERRDVDFYDAKGAMLAVLEQTVGDVRGYSFHAVADRSEFHPGIAAYIRNPEGREIGSVGEIHPHVRKAFEISRPVFGFELYMDLLKAPSAAQMTSIPRFPASTRDVSILLELDVSAKQVLDTIERCDSPLVTAVQVLEDYRDPKHVPEGHKSMLWSITYQASDRTLTDQEVDAAHQKIEEELIAQLHATRR